MKNDMITSARTSPCAALATELQLARIMFRVNMPALAATIIVPLLALLTSPISRLVSLSLAPLLLPVIIPGFVVHFSYRSLYRNSNLHRPVIWVCAVLYNFAIIALMLWLEAKLQGFITTFAIISTAYAGLYLGASLYGLWLSMQGGERKGASL